MTETRKLAAILVADVVGYSRLAGADEERTLARLRGPGASPPGVRSGRWEREGWSTTGQSSDWRAIRPIPSAAGLCRREVGGAQSCRIRRGKIRQGALCAL